MTCLKERATLLTVLCTTNWPKEHFTSRDSFSSWLHSDSQVPNPRFILPCTDILIIPSESNWKKKPYNTTSRRGGEEEAKVNCSRVSSKVLKKKKRKSQTMCWQLTRARKTPIETNFLQRPRSLQQRQQLGSYQRKKAASVNLLWYTHTHWYQSYGKERENLQLLQVFFTTLNSSSCISLLLSLYTLLFIYLYTDLTYFVR